MGWGWGGEEWSETDQHTELTKKEGNIGEVTSTFAQHNIQDNYLLLTTEQFIQKNLYGCSIAT